MNCSHIQPLAAIGDSNRRLLNQPIKGIIKLTRFDEYVWFVIVTTALGAAAGGGTFGWQWIVALLANWVAVAFAFMINDVEDADDDAHESRQDQSQSHFVQDDLAACGLHRVVRHGAPVGVVLLRCWGRSRLSSA